MPKTIELWEQRYSSLQRTFDVSLKSLYNRESYVYRVANIFFEAGFALLLTQPAGDWQNLIQKSIDLYRQSAVSKDLQSRPEYPLNLARLLHELYLAQWLLSGEADAKLLELSINAHNEGLWSHTNQPITAFGDLPLLYMLNNNRQEVQNFWKMLEKRFGQVDHLPLDLDLYRRWTDLFLMGETANSATASRFVTAYAGFARQVKDPLAMPARFYLSGVKAGMESFALKGPLETALNLLAIMPFR